MQERAICLGFLRNLKIYILCPPKRHSPCSRWLNANNHSQKPDTWEWLMSKHQSKAQRAHSVGAGSGVLGSSSHRWTGRHRYGRQGMEGGIATDGRDCWWEAAVPPQIYSGLQQKPRRLSIQSESNGTGDLTLKTWNPSYWIIFWSSFNKFIHSFKLSQRATYRIITL